LLIGDTELSLNIDVEKIKTHNIIQQGLNNNHKQKPAWQGVKNKLDVCWSVFKLRNSSNWK
jgi:hypothetical protein